jgi:hypothetical protein
MGEGSGKVMQTREGISRKISSEDVIVFGFLSAMPLWTYVFLPLWSNSSQEGHTMSAGNWTDVVTAYSGIASAFFTAIAAGAAVYAATTWLKGLKNERIDNALSAVHDLDARIDRVVAIRRANNHPEQLKLLWKSYNEAWDSRSRFNQAYVVAQRYHDGLRQFNAPNEFTELLNELRTIAERGNQVSDKDADEFKGRVDATVRATADRLRDAAPVRN